MESNSMEKTRRWLRSFFCRRKGKKRRRKEEKSFLLPHTTRSGPLPRTAPQEETRRWSFGKPEDGGNGFNFPDLASPYGAAKIAAATGFSPIHRILVPRTCGSNIILEEFASIRIQASFRAHLARKALRALKGLVKLQALVRGQLVRKQAASMLRCMETLLSIQARSQAWKACLAEEAHSNTKKQPAPRRCISLCESRNRHDCFHENIRSTQRAEVAEIDKQRAKIAQRSRGISSSIQRDNRASKFYCEIEPKQQHISSSQSEVTTSSATDRDVYPNYMANTTSSRAKARSQSAPKQR